MPSAKRNYLRSRQNQRADKANDEAVVAKEDENFYKERANNIATRLKEARVALNQNAKDTADKDAEIAHLRGMKTEFDAATIKLAEQAESSAVKDAEIARLQNVINSDVGMISSPLHEPHPDHPRGISSMDGRRGDRNTKVWADEARRALLRTFAERPDQQHAARLNIITKDIRAEDICGALDHRVDVAECVPHHFLDTAVRKGQQDFSDFLQSNITPAVGENLTKTLMLSRVKYARLNAKLFETTKENEDGNRVSVPLRFNNVKAPRLPGRHLLDKYRFEILHAFELDVEDEGLSTSVNLRRVITKDVLASIEQGFFVMSEGEVRQIDGRQVQVMKYTDTANQFKGMKVTASAVQLPDGSCTPNSPFHTSEYALYEGGDGYEDINELGRHEVEQANELLRNQTLEILLGVPLHGPLPKGSTERPCVELIVRCPLNFRFGGDQSHMNSMNCLGGCNCICPCTYCECSKHEMTNLEFDKKHTVRTRQRIILLAHAELGKCPGCDKEIVPKGEVKDRAKQVAIAVEGDVVPVVSQLKRKKGQAKVTHSSLHFGVVLGRIPPYLLEPSHWITCLLHLNLCIVRGLFTRTIVAEFGKLPQDTAEQKISHAKQVDAMAALLDQAGLKMKKNKLTKNASKEVSNYDERLKNSGLGGRDAEHLMNARNAILMLMFPEASCGPWYSDEELFASQESFDQYETDAEKQHEFSSTAMKHSYRVRRAWYTWDKTWKLLTKKMEYPADDPSTLTKVEVKKVWAARADEVFELSKIFVTCWVSSVGATQGLYLHILVKHIPDQIREYGDLNTRQTQGLKHCHAARKRVGLHATNRKAGQRIKTMLAHVVLKKESMQQDEKQANCLREALMKQKKSDYDRDRFAKLQRLENARLLCEADVGLV